MRGDYRLRLKIVGLCRFLETVHQKVDQNLNDEVLSTHIGSNRQNNKRSCSLKMKLNMQQKHIEAYHNFTDSHKQNNFKYYTAIICDYGPWQTII